MRLYEAVDSQGELFLFVEEDEYDPGVPGLHIDAPTVDGALLDRADVEQLHKALGEWLELHRA